MLLVLLSGFCSPGRWELLVLSRGLSFGHAVSLFDFLADFALEASPVHFSLFIISHTEAVDEFQYLRAGSVCASACIYCVHVCGGGGDASMAVSDLSTSQFDRAREPGGRKRERD